ncbi:MAG: cupin domain-containing protein [Clostridia bacterium]|nr:cupin domain-containing protein [Clostridia bacterium]
MKKIENAAKGLDVYEFGGRGYKRAITFKTWCLAFLTQDDEYTVNTYIERHMETDEVFVLLKGEATLYIGKERTPVKMELNKFYNVTAGTWHNIVCSSDASVLVAENSDTDKTNTEYFYL